MRPHGMASTPAANDIAPAVLAIGRPDFPNVLIDTLRRQAGVGHCMVFALTRTGAASCLLDAGNIPVRRRGQRADHAAVVRAAHVWRALPEYLLQRL